MKRNPIQAEDERTRDLSAGEADYFSRFPFISIFTAPNSWHMPLIALHDYVVAMSQLSLQANDLILDFGTGPGWMAEFAARQGLRVVGIDVSEGSLRIARKRAEDHGVGDRAHFLKGDVQRYPFRDETFQAVIVIAALHHIEDMGQAIREIHRILRPDGEVILLEPGKGHAEKEHSQQAVGDHGTLEQDVLPEDVFRWSSEAGFAEFHIVPQYFAFPAMRWNYHQWLQQREMAGARRPERTGSRIRRLIQLIRMWRDARSWRAAAKQTFPPDWLFQLHMDQWLNDHGCYLLRKSHGDRPMGSCWAGGLSATIQPLDVHVEGGEIHLRVALCNTGQALWHPKTWREYGQVRLGIQRLDPRGEGISDQNWIRFDLPEEVPPGARVVFELKKAAPQLERDERGVLDLVSEQVIWFQAKTPSGERPEVVLRGS